MKANTFIFAAVIILMSTTLFGADTDRRESADSSRKINPSTRAQIVYAKWYRVPADSLARRRAGINELTAAHNQLPLGTLVRVTNIKNNKSVVVRITDRGITGRQCKIDICKEAAKQIEILREGIVLVRLETLPKELATTLSDSDRAAAH